jgi:integrase
MLEPYRRHLKTCSHRADGPHFLTCNCPLWVYGRLEGHAEPIRESLNTRDLRRACARIEIIEKRTSKTNGSAPLPQEEPKRRRLADAVKAYLAQCATRHLGAGTIRSYHTLLAHLIDFAPAACVDDLSPEVLSRFRDQRTVTKPVPQSRAERRFQRLSGVPHVQYVTETIAGSTLNKETETLRTFCAWCADQGWLAKNPAKKLKCAESDSPGALPFTRQEVGQILGAVERLNCPNTGDATRARIRARAIVLTMLGTGLRCGDVAQLRRSAYNPKSHYLTLRYTEKTHVPIQIKLKPETIQALGALPVESPEYFFWSGKSQLETLKRSIARTCVALSRLTRLHVHAHRFRDTLASELLLNGADIRTVQQILGHRSVRTTEKYYGHFVAAHQRLLDSALDTVEPWAEAPRMLSLERV